MTREAVHSNPIEAAVSYDTAIEIISKDLCDQGIAVLQEGFRARFPDPDQVCLVPILQGGDTIGRKLFEAHPEVAATPMQMTNYDDELQLLERPRCLQKPDIRKIVVNGRTSKVAFAEAVIDSGRTLMASMGVINGQIDELNKERDENYLHPAYSVFALIDKTRESVEGLDLVVAFKVDPDIWVHGLGCDNNQEGRRIPRIDGMLSPGARKAERIPRQPYFRPLFETRETE